MQMFLTSIANIVLPDIVSRLPKKPFEYNVAFINTAAEVYEGEHWWVDADKKALEDMGFKYHEFSVTGLNIDQVESQIGNANLIFVAGGNVFYLLDQTIKSGLGQVLKKKIGEGTIYIGSSAGSMIVGRRIDLVYTLDDKSKAPDLKSDGLAITDLTVLPHWGNTEFRQEYHQGFDSFFTEGVKLIPLTNQQYVSVNESLTQIIQV